MDVDIFANLINGTENYIPTMPVLVTAQYSLFSRISTVRNSMWSRLWVNKITGFRPSMSADATLAGMPLSVPWSVQ